MEKPDMIIRRVRRLTLLILFAFSHPVCALIETFEHEINSSLEYTIQKTSDRDLWFGAPPPHSWFNQTLFSFKPTPPIDFPLGYQTIFVEKKLVSPTSRLIIFGDTHSQPITHILQKLRDDKILDEQNKLVHDNDFIVFLGDITDNGTQPIELYNEILSLRRKSPNNVFFVKGNHDEFYFSKYFGTHCFLAVPSPNNFYTILHAQLYPDLYKPDKVSIMPKATEAFLAFFFEHLPSALYVGCPDDKGNTNYLQCCHGGLEIGYNPYPFLASEKLFDQLENVTRSWFFKKYACHDISLDNHKKKDSVLLNMQRQFLAQYNQNIPVIDDAYYEYYSFFKEINKAFIGLTWNSFLTENFSDDASCFTVSSRLTTLLSKEQTLDLLTNKTDTKTDQIVSIFRGHQHHNYDNVVDKHVTCVHVTHVCDMHTCNMRNRLVQNHGWVTQWNGVVNTIVTDPRHTKCQTFALLQLAPNPADWHVTHFYRPIESDRFETRSQKLLY